MVGMSVAIGDPQWFAPIHHHQMHCLVAFARLAFPENGTAQVTISRRSSVLENNTLGKLKNESRRAIAWRSNQSAMNRMKQININMR